MSVLLRSVLVAAALVAHAHAAPEVEAQVSVALDFDGDVTSTTDSRVTEGSVSACLKLPSGCLSPPTVIETTAVASARADFGTNRASVFVRSTGADTVSTASAASFWADDWTFNVTPLSTGSFVTLRFRVDGDWNTGSARYQLGVFDPTLPPGPPDSLSLFDLAGHPIDFGSIAGASFDNASMTGLAFDGSQIQPKLASGTSETGALDWTFDLKIQPVNGRTYTVAGILLLESIVSDVPFALGDDPTPFGTTGRVDFGSTAALTEVILPPGVSFASAAGAAYNVTAIPEPGTWAMLLAGLGLLGFVRRRRPH